MENLSPDIVAATIRVATPILLAAMGGLISYQAGIFNIALEGLMLLGAFFAVAISFLTSSILLALIVVLIACASLSFIFGYAILRWKADQIIAGIAVNIFSLGLTTFLMQEWLKATGAFYSTKIVSLPSISIPGLEKIPFLDRAFNNHTILVYLSWFIVIVISIWLYHTENGINLRAVGENPDAARVAGINVDRVRFTAIIITGLLCGLAGAHLSTGYVTVFTEDMVSGRGFIAFTAIIFGQGIPGFVFAASLFFGLADSVGLWLQSAKIPAQFILMFPYVLTIVALFLVSVNKKRRLK